MATNDLLSRDYLQLKIEGIVTYKRFHNPELQKN